MARRAGSLEAVPKPLCASPSSFECWPKARHQPVLKLVLKNTIPIFRARRYLRAPAAVHFLALRQDLPLQNSPTDDGSQAANVRSDSYKPYNRSVFTSAGEFAQVVYPSQPIQNLGLVLSARAVQSKARTLSSVYELFST